MPEALPPFATLRAKFPYKPGVSTGTPTDVVSKGNKDLVESIGGQLYKSLSAIYPNLDLMNTCAVRLSYCLNRAGHRMTSAKGVRTYSGADGYLYTISADEMITYMKLKFGDPKKIWDGNKPDGKRWLAAVKPPVSGIVGYDWQGRTADFGASGHVDIGKLTSSTDASITEVGTGSYFNPGAMIVFFWECA
jgi:Type VI secretion system (T6SS), amidase effector protein 4